MKLCPICLHCYEDTDTTCTRTDRSVLVPSRHGSRLIADKYRLDKLLGRGGMGAVYAGVHAELERPAAIKLLLPDFVSDQQAMERFKREARAAARLNHPNVADTFDYGVLPGGESYIVMELVEGATLSEHLRAAGALPFHEAVLIARQVAHGIESAHRGGIVHRDLKPSNIILARDHHDALLVKVLDFGIAKLKEHSTLGALDPITKTGSLVGTPRYMSPEQCADHEVDARSDIYSLGVILYEMLAGRAPFEAPSAAALALKHIQETPLPLVLSRPDIPDDLDWLVMWALAKDPAGRPQTAAEFARSLSTVEESTHTALSPPAAADLAHHAGSLETGQHSPAPTGANHSRDTSAERGVASNPSDHGAGSDTNRAGAPTNEGSLDAPAGQRPAPEALAAPSEPESITRAAAPPPETEEGRVVTLPDSHDSSRAGTGEQASAGRPSPPKARNRAILLSAVIGLLLLSGIAAILISWWRGPVPSASSNSGVKESVSPAPSVSQEGRAPGDTRPAPQVPNNPTPAQGGNGLAQSPEAERKSLQSALDGWVAATNSRDIGGQMLYYAPRLDAFYMKRGASQEDVRAEKRNTFGQASRVSVTASDPSIQVGGDGLTAVMRFRKQYVIEAGGQSRTGEVLQELRWAKTKAGWKITSERDLQVLR